MLRTKETEIGPPTEEIQDRAAEIFREAEGLSAQEHSASTQEGETEWDGRKDG